MSTKPIVLSAVAVGGLLAAGTWAFWPGNPPALADTNQPPPVAKPATPPVGKPMVGTDDRPTAKRPTLKFEQDPEDISLMTRLPDGSYTPNLNGVREPMTWTGPFSPIVEIRRTDLGVDWWVHENGMQSTVIVVEGTMNGVPVRKSVLQIAIPQKRVLPIAEVPKKK